MSLNVGERFNNFLNTTKCKIKSFISDAQYSYSNNKNNNPYKINETNYLNLVKNNNIDIYRSDYIPMKRSQTSIIDNSFVDSNQQKSFLGQKSGRRVEYKKNIPEDKRYHKTLLQTSLQKIRNEIKQKREENSNRMIELNERTEKYNDYLRNKNNKAIFETKITILSSFKNPNCSSKYDVILV